MNPLSYQFLINIGEVNFEVMVSASEYIHFLLMTTVPFGILIRTAYYCDVFISHRHFDIRKDEKGYENGLMSILAIISTTMTPPDFISDFLVLIPMILLYEISILLVAKLERRQIQPKIIHLPRIGRWIFYYGKNARTSDMQYRNEIIHKKRMTLLGEFCNIYY